jgi:hypothetical protein
VARIDVAYNLGILSEKFDIEEAFCRRKTVFLVLYEKSGALPYSLDDTFIQLWVWIGRQSLKNHIQYYGRQDSS